ncbi:YagK/YfjJ domain-containing protein [Roseateles koreensis]|uniref:Inovirus-type Gp2 protein n=1 Tax=Roseateles koreensis TaxID=2987526 RepID=A0ABT5KWD3_9BURK|nr:inovirus-type Gp2 protein [Roseateles koreensis]MDC8787122.1 inovirus-type Gp2 protein [Roseateles koreensis]
MIFSSQMTNQAKTWDQSYIDGVFHELEHVNIEVISMLQQRDHLLFLPEPVQNLYCLVGMIYRSGLTVHQWSGFPELLELSRRWGMQCQEGDSWSNENSLQFLVEMKAAIFKLQRRMNSLQYRRIVNQSRRNGNNVYKRMIDLFLQGFEQTTRLLVCRIDCHYRTAGSWRFQQDLLTGEQFARDRDSLLRTIPGLYGEALIGYAWKLESGDRKGPHIHVTLLLDANKANNDVWAVKKLGDEWVSLTCGDGYFVNCNANFKNSYQYNALGQVLFSDTCAWQGINKIASYFAKPDFSVGFFLPNGARTFGRSESLVRLSPKPGPKRQQDLPIDFIRSLRRVMYGADN